MSLPPVDPIDRGRVRHPGGGVSRTRQADALASDVNSIVERYVVHGIVDQAPGTARYGDFSTGLDYKTALDRIAQAEAQFQDLPAHIRGHVQNDPGAFLDLVFDPARRPELEELGLVPGQDPTIADPAPVAAEAEGPSEE